MAVNKAIQRIIQGVFTRFSVFINNQNFVQNRTNDYFPEHKIRKYKKRTLLTHSISTLKVIRYPICPLYGIRTTMIQIKVTNEPEKQNNEWSTIKYKGFTH